MAKKLWAISGLIVAIVDAEICNAKIEEQQIVLGLLSMYRQISLILPGLSKNSSLCYFFVYVMLNDSWLFQILQRIVKMGFLFLCSVDVFALSCGKVCIFCS